MKILQCSIIIPVFNEKKGIQEFIHSLYNQTRQAEEIIIIDGGSTDGTYEYLKQEEEKINTDKKRRLHIYTYPCNIAEARNFAIEKTHHEIILCTDAGCKVDKHRCENLMKIYETTDEMVVGGKSEFITDSTFQKHAKHHVIPSDPNFHFISSRNISFYKHVRKKVGGYPECLTKWGEDTYFNHKIEQAGYHIFYCPQAIVKRHMGKSYYAFYQMYRNYTQGDAEVLVIYKTIQSKSIKHAIIGTLGIIILGIISIYIPYGFFILPIVLLGMGIYKHGQGGLLFDIRFNIAKMSGIIYGFRRGIFVGYRIKKTKNIL